MPVREISEICFTCYMPMNPDCRVCMPNISHYDYGNSDRTELECACCNQMFNIEGDVLPLEDRPNLMQMAMGQYYESYCSQYGCTPRGAKRALMLAGVLPRQRLAFNEALERAGVRGIEFR